MAPGTMTGFAAGLAAVFAYLLYRIALPRPIPGIPYNKISASRLLGDLPDALDWHRRRSELFTFLAAQPVKLKSPIVQVFLRPFSKPCKRAFPR